MGAKCGSGREETLKEAEVERLRISKVGEECEGRREGKARDGTNQYFDVILDQVSVAQLLCDLRPQ